MRNDCIDEGVEHKGERQQANADIPEEIIFLPKPEANSVVHIHSPHLADPKRARDFDKLVVEDTTDASK